MYRSGGRSVALAATGGLVNVAVVLALFSRGSYPAVETVAGTIEWAVRSRLRDWGGGRFSGSGRVRHVE